MGAAQAMDQDYRRIAQAPTGRRRHLRSNMIVIRQTHPSGDGWGLARNVHSCGDNGLEMVVLQQWKGAKRQGMLHAGHASNAL